MCSVSQKGGDVLPCVQVLHSPGAVHAAVWQTALQESGGQWTGAGFVSHRVLSVKTWCFLGWGGGGGGVFFLWLLLLMLSICFYDCYFGTTAWLNLCSNLFLIFLYFAFEVDITSWLNLVQIVILLLLYFVFFCLLFFFSLSNSLAKLTIVLLDPCRDGQKMSKRKKNYPDPMEIAHKFGADALRLYLVNSPAVRAENLRFKEEGVRDVVKDVFLPWYNAYRFLMQNVERLERVSSVCIWWGGRICWCVWMCWCEYMRVCMHVCGVGIFRQTGMCLCKEAGIWFCVHRQAVRCMSAYSWGDRWECVQPITCVYQWVGGGGGGCKQRVSRYVCGIVYGWGAGRYMHVLACRQVVRSCVCAVAGLLRACVWACLCICVCVCVCGCTSGYIYIHVCVHVREGKSLLVWPCVSVYV